ncbi:MAG: alcohol dehydrogenase catalytic domain-containing protein [Nitrososphaerales archaeon]
MPSTQTVRAAFVKPSGGVELNHVPKPELEAGSIIVRMKASGVCGTDLEKLTGRGITSSILGHEVSGIVVESSANGLAVGDRIIPHHHVTCNECYLCLVGAGTMCERFRMSNFVPCGFADEFLVPSYNVSHGGVHKMSSRITFEEASFAEPLGCCIRGLDHAGMLAGREQSLRNVLVVGAGPIGLLHMELLRSIVPEANIVAADVIPVRLEFAAKKERATPVDVNKSNDGAFSEDALKETKSPGFDLVIVATGNGRAFGESLRCVRKSGKVLLFGAPLKGSSHELGLSNLFLNETTITSSYSATEVELKRAIALLEERKIDVKKFITNKFSLERIEEAMSVARSEDQVKVIVTD